jgi:predicted amidohydrolase YtcJ
MPGRPAADLLLRNGKIATLDARRSVAEALAARDGWIVALGRDQDVAPLAGPETEVVDLGGRTAIPGIVDSHCHPDSWAVRLARWHSLRDPVIRSTRDVLDLVGRATRDSPPDTWFLGYRFDDQKLGGYPSRADLDAAGHGRPVFILRTDGHLGLASSRACQLVGVSRDRPDPPFGRFDRHPATGELTGLVRETAAHLFLGALGAGDTVADHVAGLERVFGELLPVGITSIHNSLASSKAIQAYQVLRAEGRLPLRVGLLVSGREEGLVEAVVRAGLRSGFGDDWLRVVGVEWCVDCSTSGRTAAYYEPYGGTPVVGEPVPNRGMLLYEADDLARRVTEAHRAGLQVCLDGVGDRGIDFCLDALEAALRAHPVADHRMRVEHCCHVTPPILERLRRLGVIDSSATGFMYDLGDAYIAQRGPDAMRWMWPHRALIDAGVPAPGHSDAPICRPDPFPAIWSMVTRQTDTGRPLGPEQAVTVEEALRAYTWLGAFAGREEHVKGSLEPGKVADVAVLDRDVLAVPADRLRETRVDLTIVGGVVRFRR